MEDQNVASNDAPVLVEEGQVIELGQDVSTLAEGEAQAHEAEEGTDGDQEAIDVSEVSTDGDAPEVA